MKKIYDFLIIGGGIVGSSLAYGLSKEKSAGIAMVDAYDNTYRASVGNYGLTWMQSKGYMSSSYAKMAERSVDFWSNLKEELESKSKIDLEFVQNGGLHFCFSKEEFSQRALRMENIGSFYENKFSKTVMLDRRETKKMYPKVGDDVYGASFNTQDGYLNPMKLWQAQLKLCKEQNVDYMPNFFIVKIKKLKDYYQIISKNEKSFFAKQLVLAAGLSNRELALQMGIDIPIKPQRGHILVTQKVNELNLLPSLNIRQAKDGALLLGYSSEDMRLNDDINENIVQMISRKALRILPQLKDIKILRSWASLRIMPIDGKSIYETIDKTLHIVSTHSAITFAPIHVYEISKSILNGEVAENFESFSLDRFIKKER